MKNNRCTDGLCETNVTPEEQALRDLKLLQFEIKSICTDFGRKSDSCRVLPVSKTIPQEILSYFCEKGEKIFGENKVQELESKYTGLSDQDPEWHFIGHLQSNKVKDCIKLAKMVHSVDRLKLAFEMDRYLQSAGKSMPILIQVNTSGEASKYGVDPANTLRLIKEISRFDTLKIKGLMTIAMLGTDSPRVRECFMLLRQISDQIRSESVANVEMVELSMGMSGDYKIAVEEGSTIVRIGQAIFGPRRLPDSFFWRS